MLSRIVFLLLLTVTAIIVFAEDTKPGDSKPLILTPPPEDTDAYGEEKRSFGIKKTDKSSNNEYMDRCTSLLRKADSLKGRPQRHKAAMDRYRLECLGGAKQDRMNKRDNEF